MLNRIPISHSSSLLNISLPFAPKNVKHRPIPTSPTASRRSASCTIASSTYLPRQLTALQRTDPYTTSYTRHARRSSGHGLQAQDPPRARGEYARLTCAVELRLLFAFWKILSVADIVEQGREVHDGQASKAPDRAIPLYDKELDSLSDESLADLLKSAPILYDLGKPSNNFVLKGGGNLLPCEAKVLQLIASRSNIRAPSV
ncbi:predicted protein [Aspergillus nidulans FGSC A4]|uniref:Uncharacterized protein n=1 Tax=Emericella nidulans (strain FGSC A4 / ATCC 38163 / CBS 112.46 / NRRL 194 / M139) TaxID=227321 RepID=Q5B265_EMENI|nr:hypothetical protein [Aspergillus nidulans FGSC A4]EAA62525.1 predicted protein [Aspergillus nidulans FGSC A4]CBF82029.1 TPA: hypothetical protein ANIA_05365 [Aspergillus nidulans FGSC A4]|eukprot:XP_662969.1 predicted protein [Aspergillus nidulans FGSC A4]